VKLHQICRGSFCSGKGVALLEINCSSTGVARPEVNCPVTRSSLDGLPHPRRHSSPDIAGIAKTFRIAATAEPDDSMSRFRDCAAAALCSRFDCTLSRSLAAAAASFSCHHIFGFGRVCRELWAEGIELYKGENGGYRYLAPSS
jgi:hypothetical protein